MSQKKEADSQSERPLYRQVEGRELPPSLFHRLPAHFHLVDDVVSESFDGSLMSGRDRLARFRDEIGPLSKIERHFPRGQESIFHQHLSTAIDPGRLYCHEHLQLPRFVGTRLGDHSLGIGRQATSEDRIGIGIGGNLVGRSLLYPLLNGFGESDAEVGSKAVAPHDGDVYRSHVRSKERLIANLITCATERNHRQHPQDSQEAAAACR